MLRTLRRLTDSLFRSVSDCLPTFSFRDELLFSATRRPARNPSVVSSTTIGRPNDKQVRLYAALSSHFHAASNAIVRFWVAIHDFTVHFPADSMPGPSQQWSSKKGALRMPDMQLQTLGFPVISLT